MSDDRISPAQLAALKELLPKIHANHPGVGTRWLSRLLTEITHLMRERDEARNEAEKQLSQIFSSEPGLLLGYAVRFIDGSATVNRVFDSESEAKKFISELEAAGWSGLSVVEVRRDPGG